MSFDVAEFVAACRDALRETDRVGSVREVLAKAISQPGALIEALGQPQRGGIETLHHADDITILNVVWTPRMTMPPHDHDMLAAIGVYAGHEDNGFWRRSGDRRIEAAGGKRVVAGEVLLMGDDAVHSVDSHPDRYTGGIHVYAGDFFNRNRRVWDAAEGLEIDNAPPPGEVFAEAERRWRAGVPN